MIQPVPHKEMFWHVSFSWFWALCMQSSKYLFSALSAAFICWSSISRLTGFAFRSEKGAVVSSLVFSQSFRTLSFDLHGCGLSLLLFWVDFFFSYWVNNRSWVFLPTFRRVFVCFLQPLIPCCSATLACFTTFPNLFCYVTCICAQPPVGYPCLPYYLGRINSLSFPI